MKNVEFYEQGWLNRRAFVLQASPLEYETLIGRLEKRRVRAEMKSERLYKSLSQLMALIDSAESQPRSKVWDQAVMRTRAALDWEVGDD